MPVEGCIRQKARPCVKSLLLVEFYTAVYVVGSDR